MVEPEEPEIPEQIEDEFHYIALRNDGTLFSIGDQTGKVSVTGKIPGIEFNTLFNSVTTSSSKTFIYEHYFDPPRGIIYVFEPSTETTTSVTLEFPEEFVQNTALVSLDWDEDRQNLLGFARQNFEEANNQQAFKLVRIDPENFKITTLEIDLYAQGYENVFSTTLINQKLYAVASKNDKWTSADLLEIDLEQKTINALPKNGITTSLINIGSGNDLTKIFGFTPVANSNLMAEVRPVIYNLNDKTSSELTAVPRISTLNPAHKTFFHQEKGEFVELVGADNTKSIFTYQPSTGDYSLLKTKSPNDLSSLVSIIGAVKI
ncbi:hypothetical protein [Salinimicrobium oceani]|uniref:Lipoprotein n=1 Tax=Salinimicrobium oceani TaxID=2722702 RepID=A0ABX1CXW6_9FLAO|nr:hypothetical protein [Salinimicrobium oceani]NJW53120.1 hypothetical protein [Salinimicrobium oceani]